MVWINTQSDGAAGHFYYTLELTNLSGHACSLSGYPGVSGVDLAGKQIGAAASRDTTTKVRNLTLKQGQTATATLRITDTGVYSASMCGQVTAAGLRVYPPNQKTSKVVPFPFGACSKRTGAFLSVDPVGTTSAPTS